jgi:hypothetical protein
MNTTKTHKTESDILKELASSPEFKKAMTIVME